MCINQLIWSHNIFKVIAQVILPILRIAGVISVLFLLAIFFNWLIKIGLINTVLITSYSTIYFWLLNRQSSKISGHRLLSKIIVVKKDGTRTKLWRTH